MRARFPIAKLLMVLGLWISLNSVVRADAQADRMKVLEERLERSVQLIEKLSARLAELERASTGAANVAPTPERRTQAPEPLQSQSQSSSPTLQTLQDSVDQITAGLSKRSSDGGLPLHGFADVGFASSSGADPQKLRGFNVGTLELYLTPQFGSRVKSLFELAFEFDAEGNSEFDIERMQLGFTVNDTLTLWAGRFHTPFGLWNTSFHHGANLQTSIFRPRFIDFEDKGGIVPAHSIGLWGSGKTTLGNGKLTYDAYLTNGPRIRAREIDFNAFTDDNGSRMLGFNLGYQAGGPLHGLTLGVHGFGSTVNAYDTNAAVLSRTRLRMAGAYFGYDASDWEAIGEYYRFSNTDADSGATRASSAWFVQIGKTFGSLTPYVRYERTSLNPGDKYFLSQALGRNYKRAALGARYALDARSSIKFELSTTTELPLLQLDENGALSPFPGGSYRRAAFQYSVAF